MAGELEMQGLEAILPPGGGVMNLIYKVTNE